MTIKRRPLSHPHYLAGERRPVTELSPDWYACARCGVVKPTRGERKARGTRLICVDCLQTEALIDAISAGRNDASGRCPVCRVYVSKRPGKTHFDGEVWVCDQEQEAG